MHLSTCGNQGQQVQHLDTAIIYLITDEKEKLSIHVLSVPPIATPISTCLHKTASRLHYLPGLNLARPVTGEQTITISMLIGADHYWDVIKDDIRGSGPTAMNL